MFHCDTCNVSFQNQYNLKYHLQTRKHRNSHIIPDTSSYFTCVCGKPYKHKNNLYRHKKSCEIAKDSMSVVVLEQNEEIDISNGEDYNDDDMIPFNPKELTTETVLELIKQNKELQHFLMEQNQKIMELASEGKYITNNLNNTNNHFNLNIFLNEKCKDAMTLNEFVESVIVQISDLEETGRLGYADGITRIFTNGLQKLDLFKRPIHCSDLKREVIYVKTDDAWEKDDADKTKIKRAIKVIGDKNIRQISNWVKKNPECKDITSKKNDEYMNIIMNSMIGGTEEESEENLNKIVHNIAKEVVIDKNCKLKP